MEAVAAGMVALVLLLSAGAVRAQAQSCDTAALSEKAQAVLRGNYDAAHGWTVPSPDVAPFLSSTDSLFAAYALSHIDPDAGMKEVMATLDGQWAGSGLVPRMRFPTEIEAEPWVPGTFFPGAKQWRAPPDGSPAARATAGLASPPWHAFVAMQLFNSRRDDAGLQFLADAFPKLYRYHSYLHQARDAGNHLVYSYHPWESELPYDSPAWTEALKATRARIEAEGWAPAVSYKAVEGVAGFPGPEVFEAELYLVRCVMHPVHRGCGHFLFLNASSSNDFTHTHTHVPPRFHTQQMELMAGLQYDDKAIQERTPFLSIDVEVNAILAYSDVSLAAMAKVLQLHSSVRRRYRLLPSSDHNHLHPLTTALFPQPSSERRGRHGPRHRHELGQHQRHAPRAPVGGRPLRHLYRGSHAAATGGGGGGRRRRRSSSCGDHRPGQAPPLVGGGAGRRSRRRAGSAVAPRAAAAAQGPRRRQGRRRAPAAPTAHTAGRGGVPDGACGQQLPGAPPGGPVAAAGRGPAVPNHHPRHRLFFRLPRPGVPPPDQRLRHRGMRSDGRLVS